MSPEKDLQALQRAFETFTACIARGFAHKVPFAHKVRDLHIMSSIPQTAVRVSPLVIGVVTGYHS